MLSLPIDITKKWIREKISDEEIFERYTGRSVRLREKFCSPLRDDSHPTCNYFITRNGVLWFKDHSGHFTGNCFDLVMFMFNVTFKEALFIIAKDFNLLDANVAKNYQPPPMRKKSKNKKRKITFKTRKWRKCDEDFWGKYYISQKLLNYFRVVPIQHLWIDNELYYSFTQNDPAYAYCFKPGHVKIYFPKRVSSRFLCNTNYLQGYDLLPEFGDLLVVTKSYKDVIALYNFGIPAVAPQSETQIVPSKQYSNLKKRFERIVSWYDFDITGVRTANKMKKEQGIKPVFLTNGRFKTANFYHKDLTDLIESVSNEWELKELTTCIIDFFRHGVEPSLEHYQILEDKFEVPF